MKYYITILFLTANALMSATSEEFYESMKAGEKLKALNIAKALEGNFPEETGFYYIAGAIATDFLDWNFADKMLRISYSRGRNDDITLSRLIMTSDALNNQEDVKKYEAEIYEERDRTIKGGGKDPMIYRRRKYKINKFVVEISKAYAYYDETKKAYAATCIGDDGSTRHFLSWTYPDVNALTKHVGLADGKEIFTFEEKVYDNKVVVSRNVLDAKLGEPNLEWFTERTNAALAGDIKVIRTWKLNQ